MRLGQAYASRFGSTALVNLGLDEWIAESNEDYVAAAVRWSGQLDALETLREQLRERMATSPLLDFPEFTRTLEAAYRQMWIDWCSGRSEPRLAETRG
jgi:predicted O-linked N-acetylglucosamine transferase (SPINDLY family)